RAGLDQPSAEPVARVQGEIPADPSGRFVSRLRAIVKPHLVFIRNHRREFVEVTSVELAHPDAVGFDDGRHWPDDGSTPSPSRSRRSIATATPSLSFDSVTSSTSTKTSGWAFAGAIDSPAHLSIGRSLG